MKLLRAIHTFDAAAGGPIEGIKQITPELSARGIETTIVSLDDPSAGWLAQTRETVVPLGPGRGGYGYSARFADWLRERLPDFDAAIIHGLWLYNGLGFLRANQRHRLPYFVMPHGMLDPWFKRAYPGKHAKKWIYWQLFERRLLERATAVLFTCEEERILARQSFWPYRVSERVINYGVSDPARDSDADRRAFYEAFPALKGKCFLLFLSRIHEKKGCENLINAYAAFIRDRRSDPRPSLVIAGPCHDPAYLSGLKELANQKLGSDASRLVHWVGMLKGAPKNGAFAASDAFLLPSYQENFGIAVVEALAASKPVLITNAVNIWREIDAAKAGLVFEPSAQSCEAAIRSFYDLDAPSRETMGRAARHCFLSHFEISKAADSVALALRSVRP